MTISRAAQLGNRSVRRPRGVGSTPTPRSVIRVVAVLSAAAVTTSLAVGLPSASAEIVRGQAQAAATLPSAAIVSDSGCATHQLARNDDESTASVSLPFRLNFYGANKTKLYVNNNGNVTFDAPLPTYTPFQITASTPPIIAAFFADIDTRGSAGVTTYGVTTFSGRPAFCVNWRHVGYFSTHTDKLDNVQLLLVNDNSQGDFDIVMNYGSIQWETGDASGAAGGRGGTSVGVGFSNGDGNPAHFYQLPGSLQNGAFLDSNSSTALATHSNLSPAIAGRYIYHIASGQNVSQANTCNANYFVSVRGSGETSTGPEDEGLGSNGARTTGLVYAAAKAHYKASGGDLAKITFYQVPYQALPTDVLTQNLNHGSLTAREDQFFFTNLPKYLGSINEGVAQLSGYLDDIDRTCASQHRSTRFILAGYSQGALIIHQYLNGLTGSRLSSLRRQIGAVALVADPAAVSHSIVRVNLGSSSANNYGICQLSIDLLTVNSCGSSNPQADISPVFAGITLVLCASGDAVCDTSRAWGDFVWNDLGALDRGLRIHTSYKDTPANDLRILGGSAASYANMTK